MLWTETPWPRARSIFAMGNFAASPNHKLLAYSVDFEGDEAYTIRVKDLATGKLLADEIPGTSYSLEWANDNATFFYTVLDAAKRPYKVFRHTLGVARNTWCVTKRTSASRWSFRRPPAGLTC